METVGKGCQGADAAGSVHLQPVPAAQHWQQSCAHQVLAVRSSLVLPNAVMLGLAAPPLPQQAEGLDA